MCRPQVGESHPGLKPGDKLLAIPLSMEHTSFWSLLRTPAEYVLRFGLPHSPAIPT